MINNFFKRKSAVCEIVLVYIYMIYINKSYMTVQYGACALHAG